MRYYLLFPLFLASMGLVFSFSSDEGSSKKKHKIAHAIMRNVGHSFSERHRMQMMGITEASHPIDKRYIEIGLAFQVRRPIPKEEGRKLLLECAEELLGQINAHPDFQPFLHEYPFPIQNIGIKFFVYDKTGRDLYHPEVTVFSLHKGKLGYYTNSPEQKCGYFSKEKETYEEALQNVRQTD